MASITIDLNSLSSFGRNVKGRTLDNGMIILAIDPTAEVFKSKNGNDMLASSEGFVRTEKGFRVGLNVLCPKK